MPAADPGSFRDPASRVFVDDEGVVRRLGERGLEAWRALSRTRFYTDAVADGRLIESVEGPGGADAAAVLRHPRLEVITYPYEWTFSMLRDAALLQLDLLAEALAEGLAIKDATPFNIQFVAGRPMFIDVGSFEAYRDGDPWIGYRQFTRQFLFPLMMRAWAGLPHRAWLRGHMEGPTAAQMRSFLPRGRRMRPGAALHVSLQARMEERFSGEAARGELAEAGFSAELILANVRKLRRLVESLEWEPEAEGWSEYRSCPHAVRDRDAKGDFLRSALGRRNPATVADFGANDGHFSDIAVDMGALAVAIDSDEPVLDDLYRRSPGRRLSVVVADLADPSPAQGWAGRERPALFDRVRPDLIIAYGVVHHLVYTASVPPAEVVRWLRSFGAAAVVELAGPDDAMVRKLTGNKLEGELHVGRTEAELRELIGAVFEVVSEKALEGGSRVLLELTPR